MPTDFSRTLVCGGREYRDRERVHEVLDALPERPEVIIHGAARGADSLAGEWASERDVECESYPADWDRHRRAAGSIRNKRMLILGRPTVVIAFPGGRGTANMRMQARGAGVPVIDVPA